MKNKVILTSIVSLCFAMPAFAEFTSGQQIADENGLLNGMACDEDTLGVTQDTANLEAIWTPNTYSISYTCANGENGADNVMVPLVDCEQYPTDSTCINSTHAVYGYYFNFATGRPCREKGYQSLGWSCTRDNVPNDMPTEYLFSNAMMGLASLDTWDIDSDLTCTEVRVGNTIGLNWYEDEEDTTPTTSQCTYGTTSGQGALTLPSQPSARPGYTFDGWKVLGSLCGRYKASNTCNMNSGCFWYKDLNTGTGSCVSVDGCSKVERNNSTACNALGYCSYLLRSCTLPIGRVLGSMNNAEECSVHGGVWEKGSCMNVNTFCHQENPNEAECLLKNSLGHGEICGWNGEECHPGPSM